MKVNSLRWIISPILLSACVQSPQQIVPKPTDITIGSAIMQVRDGLVEAQKRSRDNNEFAGLYPCTATIVFNVTAKADNSNTLVLDASIKPPVPGAPSLGISETYASSAGASVGNQITVTLGSSLCLAQTTGTKQTAPTPSPSPSGQPASPPAPPRPLILNPPNQLLLPPEMLRPW